MDKSRVNKIQDPDYYVPIDAGNNYRENFEKNARKATEDKISAIIEKEFSKEIQNKKDEVLKIYQTLEKAVRTLHYLRFAIVTDFYHKEHLILDEAHESSKQYRPHPTVNGCNKKLSLVEAGYSTDCFEDFYDVKRQKLMNEYADYLKEKNENKDEELKKVEVPAPVTGANCKSKKTIVVGNVSKWIPSEIREHDATHRWTVYVRDVGGSAIEKYVSKVRFFLHPSYKPKDVVDLSSPPFHLSRLGWGEFPIRVQLYFSNGFNKPIDIIHHLTLDKTFTGLQTVGSETVANIWISSIDLNTKIQTQTVGLQTVIKSEYHDEVEEKSFNICEEISDHDYLLTHSRDNNKDPEKTTHKSQNKPIDETQVLLSQKAALTRDAESNHELKPTNSTFNKNGNNLDDEKSNFGKKDYNVKSLQPSKMLTTFMKQTNHRNLNSIFKLVAKQATLIDERATDNSFAMLHPYTSKNFSAFCNYPIGKQRALERFRALSGIDAVKSTKDLTVDFTVNEFMIWARRYCYTPFLDLAHLHKLCAIKEFEVTRDLHDKYKYSSTTSNELNEWISKCKKIPGSNLSIGDDDHNEPIDILNVEQGNSSASKYNSKSITKNCSCIEINCNESILNEFVSATAQKIGIKLVQEEIVPGVLHNTTNVLLSKTVECLMEELLRLSFSCALDRFKENNQNTLSIDLNDVRMALLKKENFDLFTNAGLGSEG